MKTFFCWIIVFIYSLNIVFSQTSGPSTPEVQKFTPSSVNNMVNHFTGDFNYNINILEFDSGYPINLSYSSNVNMVEEASNVGFGWQLNIGRINRTVRGLPDDFKGDKIIKEMSQKTDWNVGIGAGVDAEIFGLPVNIGVSGGINFSNIRGIDLESNIGLSTAQKAGPLKLSGGLSLGMSTNEGASISPNAGISYMSSKESFTLGVSAKYSSMEGIKSASIGLSHKNQQTMQSNNVNFPLMMARTPFTPKIDFPSTTYSGSLKFRGGAEFWGGSFGADVYGKFSYQKFNGDTHTRKINGYGYLFLQNMPPNGAIMDMATEKETPIFREDPYLNISYLTNDVFSVSAQGLSGTFRPFRRDVGIAHHENIDSKDYGGSIGGEIHGLAYFQGGIDVSANLVSNYNGEWRDNKFMNKWKFKDSTIYFKSIGEANGFVNENMLTKTGGLKPSSFGIDEFSINSLGGNELTAADITKRAEPRNQIFQYLNGDEASSIAGKSIVSYKDFGINLKTDTLSRTDSDNKRHHISLINITKDDGSIYEFGIAAYNNKQKEVSFNIKGKDDIFSKTTAYNQGVDNSFNNTQGKTDYFTSTETPAYAYAYLLTAVYSADYQDLTGNGPTSDDFGTYTKFNYTREYIDFKWRTPYNDANYNAGNLCDKGDDMANYVYGEKEIWTIHSIETKNYIAEFHTSKRNDAYEVSGENGGRGTNSLYKIDSIRLFSKIDYYKNREKAVPIKTIFFTYDESLCPNIPASNVKGKLTLKNLNFKYDNSNKEKHSYYSFKYNNEKDIKYKYDESKVDRWGTFKDSSNNIRFPYSEQNLAKANRESQAWHLNEILLPTGGKIAIDYEAKDYAYVQDKLAMQMYKIVGFSKSPLTSPTNPNLLYEETSLGIQYNNFLLLDLGRQIDDNSIKTLFQSIPKIYLNCIVDVGAGADIQKEEISGYFDYSYSNINPINRNQVWIALKSYKGVSNPVSQIFWQKMRKSLNHVLYPAVINFKDENPVIIATNAINGLGKVLGGGIFDFFKSYEQIMVENKRGQKLDETAISFVRLNNIDGKKIGGGSRVKQIKIFDNWHKMTQSAGDSVFYGQEYDYTTEEGKSSGVATYEPFGIEENPFLVPTGEFNNGNPLAPELYYYKTEPIGESFFPAPSIGYSRVAIKNILPKNVTQNAAGYEVHEFYTAKDFPTITKQTQKIPLFSDPSLLSAIEQYFSNYTKEYYTASQGFYIELNDMHGKPKADKYFSQLDLQNPLSGTEFKYKNLNGKLDNNVRCINPKTGNITDKKVGLDFDFYVGTEESSTETISPTVQFNVDVIPAFFGIPLPIPTILATNSTHYITYKGVTTTKVVYRSGIIDTVLNYHNGSKIIAKNILYDEISGEPLVVATQNEYQEPVYSTKLPAHWFYEGMGFAYENADLKLTSYDLANIKTDARFAEADHLLLTNGGVNTQGWVFKNSINERYVIDEKGNAIPIPGLFDIKIIRSGRKNMQSIPVSQIITKADPTRTNNLKFEQVIDASVVEYDQRWQTYNGLHPDYPQVTCECKPSVLPENFSFFNESTETSIFQNRKDVTFNGNEIIIQLDKNKECEISSPDRTVSNDVLRNQSSQASATTQQIELCTLKIKLDQYLPYDLVNLKCPSRLEFEKLTLINDGLCSNKYTAEGIFHFVGCENSQSKFKIDGKFTISTDCCPFQECTKKTEIVSNPLECIPGNSYPVNPYILGILGDWRPKASWKYVANRTYNASLPQKEQGFFETFNLFQAPIFSVLPADSKTLWQAADYAEIFDPHGKPVESLNALKLPSSQIYGYGFNLPMAVTNNANYYETAFDGFEDYDFKNQVNSPYSYSSCTLPLRSRFNFSKIDSISTPEMLFSEESHTGKKSLFLRKNVSYYLEKKIEKQCENLAVKPTYTGNQYILQKCDVIQDFSPAMGKEYVFSLWMKETRTNDQLDESLGTVNLSFYTATNTLINRVSFKAKGPIIDNWQQINETFTVPVGASKFKIEVQNITNDMLVDDIRIHPFNSSMKSYIYDPVKLRLMATLDEQNYATFYEYDGEGQLTRTKKETERGIMTVQEVRSAKPKTAKIR